MKRSSEARVKDTLLLFDVDGTLVDSQAVITETMAQAFEHFGYVPPRQEVVLSKVGISLPELIAMLLPEEDAAAKDRVTDRYRSAYGAVAARGGGMTLYPGVADGVRAFAARGHTMGIATGKSRRGVERMIADHGWADLWATKQCADDHPSKPHPSMIERALLETATAPERAVMIGDTTFDMEMAARAGIAAIGVGWGYHPVDKLWSAGARAVVEQFDDLFDAVAEVLA